MLTAAERRTLQIVVRRGEHNGSGYCRWREDVGEYEELVERGLLHAEKPWKETYLRLTDQGWDELMHTPVDDR